jgi:dihydrofolate synthase/folylpolyglutamate synthase
VIETDWRFKNYDEVIEFLESREKYGSKPGMKRIRRLLGVLGNPEDRVYTIHIAGTNGKGSVGAYLESIIHQDRMYAFHFSSPAVFDWRDCWKRFGDYVSEYYLIGIASKVYAATHFLDRMYIHPTRFEVETAMGILGSIYFHNDYLILETGMGGLNDATNIIKWPKICVFTDISYDHMQFLGESLTEIATEKAGIIKPGCKVFSADQAPEVKAVLDEKMLYGKVTYVDSSALELISQKPGELRFRYQGREYETSMSGLYQMKNAALAIEIARNMKFPEDMIADGIKAARGDGRFEVLSKEPYFIIDGAHNVDAIKQ